MDLERVRDEWDAQAAAFDHEPDHGLLTAEVRAAWWSALQKVLPPAPSRVADLGCGTGSIAVLLAEHHYEVSGIDLSPKMIELARAKAQTAECSVRFDTGNAAEPDLGESSFEVVFARHVVWALPDPSAALARWARLLVPGGRFVMVEGRWSTGAGLTANGLVELLAPITEDVQITSLTDPLLWGKQINDERYLLVGLR